MRSFPDEERAMIGLGEATTTGKSGTQEET
jgi:hypothetical protein